MIAPHEPWAQRPHWCILQTGSGRVADFLHLRHAWQQDAQRPERLHVVLLEPWPAPEAIPQGAPAPLGALGRELQAQWWGLTPGLHRLAFEDGRVLLSLFVGLPGDALRELTFTADTIRLGPPGPDAPRDLATIKALTRLCRRGTRLWARQADAPLRHALASAGFVGFSGSVPSEADDDALAAVYDPAWQPKGLRPEAPTPSEAVVIGGGLAGAAAAASLARRGWRVQVLDRATAPASGASALPAGLMAPHLSPDDGLLSRLSRSGVRLTRGEAQRLLRAGIDWGPDGALEHRIKPNARPVQSEGFAADWSRSAGAAEMEQALLPDMAQAAWHAPAAWVRPAALVRAWLDHPRIQWRGGAAVASLEGGAGQWRVRAEQGEVLADAPQVVLAAALGSAALSGHRLLLQPVRGQVSWAPHDPGLALPPFPVNGNGHFLPAVPIDGATAWMCGSSYGRGDTDTAARAEDHAANFARIRTLLPMVAPQLAPAFTAGRVQAWCGVRCASTDRRPLVGEIEPGLSVSTAMGSRGLTFAALCGELLAARLHGEPLPLPLSLAMALDVRRQLGD